VITSAYLFCLLQGGSTLPSALSTVTISTNICFSAILILIAMTCLLFLESFNVCSRCCNCALSSSNVVLYCSSLARSTWRRYGCLWVTSSTLFVPGKRRRIGKASNRGRGSPFFRISISMAESSNVSGMFSAPHSNTSLSWTRSGQQQVNSVQMVRPTFCSISSSSVPYISFAASRKSEVDISTTSYRA